MREKNRAVAHTVEEDLSRDEEPSEDCLADLRRATDRLDRDGFWWRPSWANFHAGHHPPDIDQREPGEWRHGWQYWSSSVSDSHHRMLTMLLGRTAVRRAHIRSHSGRNAGVALAHCPTAPEFTIEPYLFRTLLLKGCACHGS